MIKTYLKNIPGFRTKEKIIIFAVDDYGNIRQNNRKTLDEMEKSCFSIQNHFDRYDGLSTSDDLTALFDILSKYKDSEGNNPIFTVFSNPQNINFYKVKESGYKKIFYEDFTESIKKYCQDDTLTIWKQGLDNGYLQPEYHGRTHFHEGMFLKNLENNEKQTIWCIDNNCYTGITAIGNANQSYLSPYTYNDLAELTLMKGHLEKGIEAFERIFHRKPLHFTAPGNLTHEILEKSLADNGIKFIDTLMVKRQHEGNQKYSTKINWLGKKNEKDQIFILRNCVFEPKYGFDSTKCLKQICAAFVLNKPAIISTHRVNFCGRINEENRKSGLEELENLIKKVIKKYPDVKFCSIGDLAEIMINN